MARDTRGSVGARHRRAQRHGGRRAGWRLRRQLRLRPDGRRSGGTDRSAARRPRWGGHPGGPRHVDLQRQRDHRRRCPAGGRDVRQSDHRVRHRCRRHAGEPAGWASFGGLPTDRNLQAALAQQAVAPDGWGLDGEGDLWFSDALAGRLLRIREGGEVLEKLPVGTGVFACVLGSHDGHTLFLCTAPDFDRTARSAAREARLLSCRVDVPHAGRP
jgi:hypothetical protein